MKVRDVITEAEQELLTRDNNVGHATSIGQQILHRAQQEAYNQGRARDVAFIKQLADKMVNRFAGNILASIEEELKFSQTNQVER